MVLGSSRQNKCTLMNALARVGGKKVCRGGGGLSPIFSPQAPPQGSNVRQPERVWEGLGMGVRGYPPYVPQNDLHDAPII